MIRHVQEGHQRATFCGMIGLAPGWWLATTVDVWGWQLGEDDIGWPIHQAISTRPGKEGFRDRSSSSFDEFRTDLQTESVPSSVHTVLRIGSSGMQNMTRSMEFSLDSGPWRLTWCGWFVGSQDNSPTASWRDAREFFFPPFCAKVNEITWSTWWSLPWNVYAV